MAGVSAGAITKACSKALAPACYGKRIYCNHPAAIKYLNEKSHPQKVVKKLVKKTAKKVVKKTPVKELVKKVVKKTPVKKEKKTVGKSEPAPTEKSKVGAAAKKEKMKIEAAPKYIKLIPADIWKVSEMTFGEVVAMFGSDGRFIDWVRGAKLLEDLETARLKNAITKGQLVAKNAIKQGILNPIETVHKQILTDGSKSIATRVRAKALSGSDDLELETFVRELLEKYFKPMKQRMVEAMKAYKDV